MVGQILPQEAGHCQPFPVGAEVLPVTPGFPLLNPAPTMYLGLLVKTPFFQR